MDLPSAIAVSSRGCSSCTPQTKNMHVEAECLGLARVRIYGDTDGREQCAGYMMHHDHRPPLPASDGA
jgi:hypothetical protein